MPTTLSKKALEVKNSSTLAITAGAKALKAKGIDIVTFGVGEPDFDTPVNIKNAAKKAMDDGKTKYTDATGIKELKEAISRKFKEYNNLCYDPDQVVVSNGGKQTLHNIFTAIINPGDEVIIPSPFWLTYPELVKLVDGVPIIVQCPYETKYKITPELLEKAITPRTKALVLNSPVNPTGQVYSKDELKAIGDLAVKYDFFIVSDEMYEILNYTGEASVSIGSLSPEIFEHTITSSGVSKSYAMTGWRIGYSGSSKELAKVIGSIQSHQSANPSSISQYAALEALTGPQESIDEMTKVFERRRDLIYDRVSEMRYLKTIKPEGAFYLYVNCSEIFGKKYNEKVIENIYDIADILLNEYYTAVIPCADFGTPDYMRLSYATSENDINRGLDRIEKFLLNLK